MGLVLFRAGLELDYEEVGEGVAGVEAGVEAGSFEQEFHNLSSGSKLNYWKKQAAKADLTEGEGLLFELLFSIKEDLMRLENKLISNQKLLPLKHQARICGLNFDCLEFAKPKLSPGRSYYARLSIKDQLLALFFTAENERLARISRIKPGDRLVYDALVVQIQQEFIRSQKSRED